MRRKFEAELPDGPDKELLRKYFKGKTVIYIKFKDNAQWDRLKKYLPSTS